MTFLLFFQSFSAIFFSSLFTWFDYWNSGPSNFTVVSTLVIRLRWLALLTDHWYRDGMLITCCRIITYVLLWGYTPFRADDMKEVMQQTTKAMVYFHGGYLKNISMKVRRGHVNVLIWSLGPGTLHPNRELHLLNSDPTSPTAESERALSPTWLTSIAALTERDLCGLRENFNLCPCWRNVIGAVRACFGSRKVMAQAISQPLSPLEIPRPCQASGDRNCSKQLSPPVPSLRNARVYEALLEGLQKRRRKFRRPPRYDLPMPSIMSRLLLKSKRSKREIRTV